MTATGVNKLAADCFALVTDHPTATLHCNAMQKLETQGGTYMYVVRCGEYSEFLF